MRSQRLLNNLFLKLLSTSFIIGISSEAYSSVHTISTDTTINTSLGISPTLTIIYADANAFFVNNSTSTQNIISTNTFIANDKQITLNAQDGPISVLGNIAGKSGTSNHYKANLFCTGSYPITIDGDVGNMNQRVLRIFETGAGTVTVNTSTTTSGNDKFGAGYINVGGTLTINAANKGIVGSIDLRASNSVVNLNGDLKSWSWGYGQAKGTIYNTFGATNNNTAVNFTNTNAIRVYGDVGVGVNVNGTTKSSSAINAINTSGPITFDKSVNANTLTTGTGAVTFAGTTSTITSSIVLGDVSSVVNFASGLAGSISANATGSTAVNFTNTTAKIVTAGVGLNQPVNTMTTSTGGLTFNEVVNANTSLLGSGAVIFKKAVTGDVKLNNSASSATYESDVTGAIDNISGGAGTTALNFTSSSTVSGPVGSTSNINTINTAASPVTFSSIVKANTTTTGAGLVRFMGSATSNVNLSNTASVVTFEDVVTGNLDNTSGSIGSTRLNLNGSHTITHTIGATNPFHTIAIGGGDIIFSSSPNASNFIVGSGSATFMNSSSSNIVLADQDSIVNAGNISGSVTTNAGDKKGTLNIKGLNKTISGLVGANGARLALVTTESNGSATFTSAVFAEKLELDGTNNFSADVTGDIEFKSASAEVNAGNITGNVKTIAGDKTGVLNIIGNKTIDGTIGATGAWLQKLTTALNSVVNFNNVVLADSINLSGTGNFAFGVSGNIILLETSSVANVGDVTGNVTTTGGNGYGKLNVTGSGRVINGFVGESNKKLELVTTGSGDVNFKGDVFANNVEVGGLSTFDANISSYVKMTSSSSIVSAKENITGIVSTATDGEGELHVTGSNKVVSTVVGESGKKLALVKTGSGLVTFEGDVFANHFEIWGPSLFVSNIKSNIKLMHSTSVANIGETEGNITTAAGDKTGRIDITGTNETISGYIGASGARIGVITTDSGRYQFMGPVFAENLELGGTNNFADEVTGDIKFKSASAEVNAGNITGNVSTVAGDKTGTLNITGTRTIDGTIGATGAWLQKLTTGVDTVTFNGDVFAHIMYLGGNTVFMEDVTVDHITTKGTANFKKTLHATNALVQEGVTTFADDVTGGITLGLGGVSDAGNITGDVTTNGGDQTGTLNIKGLNKTIGGFVGASGASLALVTTEDNGSATFSRPVYSKKLEIGGISNFNDDVTTDNIEFKSVGAVINAGSINGIVTTIAGDKTGRLNITGTRTIGGSIGATGAWIQKLTTGVDTVTFNNVVFAQSIESLGTVNFNNAVSADSIEVDETGNFAADVSGSIILRETSSVANVGNVTGNVTTTGGNGYGKLNVTGSGRVINEFVGESNKKLELVTTGSGDVNFKGDVFANNVEVGGLSTFDANISSYVKMTSSSSIVSAKENITGIVSTATDGEGELHVTGSNKVVSTVVGESGKKLALVKTGSGLVTFEGDVFANNFEIWGPSLFVSNIDGNIKLMHSTSVANIGETKGNITTAAGDKTGRLDITGTNETISGYIGASGASLALITTDSGKSRFIGPVFAENLEMGGNSTFDSEVTGDIKFKTASAEVNAGNIKGNVSTVAGDKTGTLNITGTRTIDGTIGATGAWLQKLTTGTDTVTFNGDVFAENVEIGGNEAIFGAKFVGNILLNGSDSTITLGPSSDISGNITTQHIGKGSVVIKNGAVLAGGLGTIGIGSPATMLKTIKLGDASEGVNLGTVDVPIAFANNIHADELVLAKNTSILPEDLNLSLNDKIKVNKITGDGNLIVSEDTSGDYDIGTDSKSIDIIFNHNTLDKTLTFENISGNKRSLYTNISSKSGFGKILFNAPVSLYGTIGSEETAKNLNSITFNANSNIGGTIYAPVILENGVNLTIDKDNSIFHNIDGSGVAAESKGAVVVDAIGVTFSGTIGGTNNIDSLTINPGKSAIITDDKELHMNVTHNNSELRALNGATIKGHYSSDNGTLKIDEGTFKVDGKVTLAGNYTVHAKYNNNIIILDYGTSDLEISSLASMPIHINYADSFPNGGTAALIIKVDDEEKRDLLFSKLNEVGSNNILMSSSVTKGNSVGSSGSNSPSGLTITQHLDTSVLDKLSIPTSQIAAAKQIIGSNPAVLEALGSVPASSFTEAVGRYTNVAGVHDGIKSAVSSTTALTNVVTARLSNSTISQRSIGISGPGTIQNRVPKNNSITIPNNNVNPTSNNSNSDDIDLDSNQNSNIDSFGMGIAAGDITEKYGLWAQVIGGMSNQDIRKNNAAFKSTSVGGMAGVDSMVSERSTIGFAVGNVENRTKHKGIKSGDKTISKSWMMIAYGNYEINNHWFVKYVGVAATHAISSLEKRIGASGNADITASSKYKMQSYSIELSSGYNYFTSLGVITPSLGILGSYGTSISYTERGAGVLNKHITHDASRNISAVANIAFRAKSYNFNDVIIEPELHCGVQYGLGMKSPKGSLRPVSSSDRISFVGTKPAALLTTVGSGITASRNNMEYNVGYDMKIGDKYLGHQATVKIKIKF